MPKIKIEELKGEARLLADEYNKRIADLQKRKAEALKRYEEKTEKLRIKLMKQLVNDISDICGGCTDGIIKLTVEYLKENKEGLQSYIKENMDPEKEG